MKLIESERTELHVLKVIAENIYSINKDQTYRSLMHAVLEIYDADVANKITNEHVQLLHKLYDLVTTISRANSELHIVLANNITLKPVVKMDAPKPDWSDWEGVEGRNGPPGS